MMNLYKALTRTLVDWWDRSLLQSVIPEDRKLILQIRSQKLTYLSIKKLISLAETCRSIQAKELPGIFLEAGCALGGSSILIASVKDPKRHLLVYDVFDMIPPPTSEDTKDVHKRYQKIATGKSTGLGGDVYYGYQKNLYEKVQKNLAGFGIDLEAHHVSLIKGMVQDTMKIDEPVALAHVDVDWYEPVMTCLQRISPHLIIGGSIILDDYYVWGGCRKATDEFLQGVTGQFISENAAGSMKLTRVKDP